MQELNSITALVWAALGAIGGIVKVLVQLLGAKVLPTNKAIFWMLTANAFVSGFSGFLGAVLMSQISHSDDLHVVAAGICGYMGVAALDLLSTWARDKLSNPIK